MENNNVKKNQSKARIILLILLILVAIACIVCIVLNGKEKNEACKCSTDTCSLITGEITSINDNELTVKTDDKKDIRIRYTSNINFKIGDNIKATYDGSIKDSNPPLITATCIEKTK